jgi:hypothetical protein
MKEKISIFPLLEQALELYTYIKIPEILTMDKVPISIQKLGTVEIDSLKDDIIEDYERF